MENHEPNVQLKIGECDKSAPQGSTDGFAPVGYPELPKGVSQMGLNRGDGEAEIVCQTLGGVAFGDSPKYLHLPRGKRDTRSGRDWTRFRYSPENLGNHSPRYRALASERRQQSPFQFMWPYVFKHVTGAAGAHHPEQVVAGFGYSPRNDLRGWVFCENRLGRCWPIHRWHMHVHKHQIWPQHVHSRKSVGTGRRFAHKPQVLSCSEHGPGSGSRDDTVVNN
jgi:hypothetical protein